MILDYFKFGANLLKFLEINYVFVIFLCHTDYFAYFCGIIN